MDGDDGDAAEAHCDELRRELDAAQLAVIGDRAGACAVRQSVERPDSPTL